MGAPELAIGIFIAVFAIASFRNVHLGVLMLPAAVAVGVWLADMSVGNILDGFPINILVLIAGVTFLFGIASSNGTVDLLIRKLVGAVGDRRGWLPYLFFLITTGVASMGSPQAGYVVIPLAMAAARRSAIDPMVMAVALNSGMSTGGFAPTSLFGIVTVSTAAKAGIALNPLVLLGIAALASLILLIAATFMFPSSKVTPVAAPSAAAASISPAGAPGRFASHQIVTLICILILTLSVLGGFSMGRSPDIGVIALGLGAALALMYPASGAEGVKRIDWGTIFMVGGIVTFVGVLQEMDAVNMLGHAAMTLGSPYAAAFVIFVIAGLVSAFASTTGILTALVPMSVPLAVSGGVSGWALMSLMGVCAAIVDASPFSTSGALIVAAGAEEERPRLKSFLTRWGLSMVIVGPVVAVIVLMLMGRS
jgi:di/tricarboxylate transporter